MEIAVIAIGCMGIILIVANRFETKLKDMKEKVYTPDIFNSDS